jgi:hypothetical protein
LPPRSSRWRWTRPGLAWSGATPLWRASCASEWSDRSGRARRQLRCGQRAAAGQLEQRRRGLRGPLLQLAIELDDRARERTAACDQIARDPHLDLRLLSREPAADAIEPRRPVEVARGNGEAALVAAPLR